jgi:hypothetical protein
MNRKLLGVVAWSWVVAPFAYGVYQLFRKVALLFH